MLIVLRVLSKLFRMLIVLLRVLQRTGATLQDAGDDQQRWRFRFVRVSIVEGEG